MLVIALLTPAHALTCGGANPNCQLVLDMVADVNAHAGTTVMADGAARADLRPGYYVSRFTALDTLLQAGGCTIEGHIAGTYSSSALGGGWDGGPLAGGIRPTPRTFQVSMVGGDDVGFDFSDFHAGKQLVADRSDGGFVAGYWARTVGDNGVFLGVHGSCAGAPQDTLDAWYPGSLAGWPTGQQVSQLVQNHDGVCVEEVGCEGGGGTSGNPNELVECFVTGLGAPITVSSVDYTLGAVTTPPDSLNIEIYEWAGAPSAPGAKVQSVPVGPGDLSSGPHTVNLPGGITVGTSSFCIGVNGLPLDDGYRIMKSQTQSQSSEFSWVLAPTCGLGSFGTTATIGFPGNWCISAEVEGTL